VLDSVGQLADRIELYLRYESELDAPSARAVFGQAGLGAEDRVVDVAFRLARRRVADERAAS
jgi:hypothetical protein